MVNFAQENQKQDLLGKNALIVGGTQGIGAGIAKLLGGLGANVVIAGRSKEKALEIFEFIRTARETSGTKVPELQFFRVDASSIDDVKRFAKEIEAYYTPLSAKVDILIQTQGGPPNTWIDETKDELGKAFQVSCFSRWLIPYLLISSPTSILSETARCVSICNPGRGKDVDLDDISLLKWSKTHSSGGIINGIKMILAQSCEQSSVNDAMTIEFAKRYPMNGFYHLYPGIVDTNVAINTNQHWMLQKFMSITAPILGVKPETYANVPVYIATTHENGYESPGFVNHKGGKVTASAWALDETNRKNLWDWAMIKANLN